MKKVSSFVIGVCLVVVVLLGSCTSDLLETIEEDIADQREKDALEQEEGKTPETRKPVITLFAWQGVTGGTTNNPTVLFNCTAEAKAVSSTGAATINGYFLSQTATTPAVDAVGWIEAKPVSFSFPPVNGAQALYLWVRHSFGNISSSSPLSITLAPLALSWNAIYKNGMMVPAHEVFLLSAAEPLVLDDAVVSGAGAGTVSLSGTGNQTITVSPASRWTAGSRTLSVAVKTAYGLTATATRSLSIFNGVCVSTTGSGAEGTAREPVGTIPAGITRAQVLYPGAGEVRIAQGEYTTNWAGNTNRITLINGISLYGGYNTAWTARNISGYPVVIRDLSSGGGIDAANANRAIDIPSTVTNVTVIDGLRIYGGGGAYSTGVFCKGSSVIENNHIFAGTGAGTYRIGLYLRGDLGSIAEPEIKGCHINEGSGGSTSNTATFGIWGYVYSTPQISGCIIFGGTASNGTAGIRLEDCSGTPVIEKNRIEGGSASTTYGIYLVHGTSFIGATVVNNLVFTGISDSNSGCMGVRTTTNSVVFRNNTVHLGDSDYASHGFYSASVTQGATIENNLFVLENDGTTVYGVWKESGDDYTSLNNNGFSGFTDGTKNWLYWVSGGASYNESQLSDINALPFASDNRTGEAYLDSEFRLTGSSVVEYRTGGINGADAGWSFSDDFSGTIRTGSGSTGWSMGCFEY